MAETSVGEIGLDLVVNQNQFNKQMSGIAGLAKKAGAALAAAIATKKIVDFGKKCVDLGSDLSEVQNVVDVTFPKMTAQVDKFAKSAAASFGLSETMAKRYAGTFGSMAKAFGFTEKQAYDMGTTLTGLAGDVASFYNISQDEAYTKLKSVFTGETESLKDLGVVMTQSALDAYALANGFGKTTQAMSEAEKVALRYQFVQSKLAAAQGDFIRTSDSWANQCRILSLQTESFMATIGQGLINLLTPVIKIINTVMGKLMTLANAFKSFTALITGKQSSGTGSVSQLGNVVDSVAEGMTNAAGAADGLSGAAEGVGKAAKKAAQEMRALMGFDKIQKLSEPSDSSSNSDTGSSGAGAGSGSGGMVDFGSLAQGETVIDDTDKKLQGLFLTCKQLAGLFKKGFRISFGNSAQKIKSIEKAIGRIGKTLQSIFEHPAVTAHAKKFANSVILGLGKIAGSAANIGLSVADNLFGGVNRYLIQNRGFIRSKIVSIFNVSSDIANLSGEFTTAVADIFGVFSSPSAKQITADVIGIFADGFLGSLDIALKFVADLASLVIRPITDNVGKIRYAFENILAPISVVLSTLHTSIQNTFAVIGQMYEAHIKPMVDAFIAGVSSIVSALLDGFNTYIAPVLDSLAAKFGDVWSNHVQPVINTAIGLIGKISDLITALWQNVLRPIITEFITISVPVIAEALESIGSWVLDLIATISDVADGILKALGGVIDFFTGVFTQDWGTATQGLQEITEGLRKAVSSIFSFLQKSVLKPFDDFLTGVFKRDWTKNFGAFGSVLNTFFAGAKKVWDGIKKILNGIIDFISDVFEGNWESAWQRCVNAFDTVFGGLVNIVKAPVNGVISLLNGLIGAVNSLLSAIESRLRFDFTIPNPFGGTIVDYHWHATLPRINWRIPALAEGGFVKKNTPQLAMIGDNRHQGEVVAPEDKLLEMAMAAAKAAAGSADSSAVLALLREILAYLKNTKLVAIDPEALRKYFIEKTNQRTDVTGVCELKF